MGTLANPRPTRTSHTQSAAAMPISSGSRTTTHAAAGYTGRQTYRAKLTQTEGVKGGGHSQHLNSQVQLQALRVQPQRNRQTRVETFYAKGLSSLFFFSFPFFSATATCASIKAVERRKIDSTHINDPRQRERLRPRVQA